MSLRTILMIIGFLIIAAILIDGYRHWRRAKKQKRDFEGHTFAQTDAADLKLTQTIRVNDEREPTFQDEDVLLTRKKPLIIDELYGQDEPVAETATFIETEEPLLPQPAPAAPSEVNMKNSNAEKIIIFHILAAPNTHLSGVDLAAKFASQGLCYGPMHIYHKYENDDGSGPILFSVANAFEPGTLNLDYPESFYTRGLTLFMQLPGRSDPEQSFETMLNTATVLAKSLQARLCDKNREPLTVTTVQQYRQAASSYHLVGA